MLKFRNHKNIESYNNLKCKIFIYSHNVLGLHIIQ